jgi:NAD(P)-dependent dehydrogenase (short-subunit alcohol dehydrogenase family)
MPASVKTKWHPANNPSFCALPLQYAAYGATKIGIAQLQRTMQVEAAGLPNPVGVHNLSPGMVLTELLLEGATPANKQVCGGEGRV